MIKTNLFYMVKNDDLYKLLIIKYLKINFLKKINKKKLFYENY